MREANVGARPAGSSASASRDVPAGPEDLRHRLEEEIRAAAERLKRIEERPESLADRPTGLDVFDEAEASATREALFASRERLTARIRQLQAALGRLEAGTYGRCVECGGPIGAARLRVVPTATTCVGCQQRHEQAAAASRPASRRPIDATDAALVLAEATGGSLDAEQAPTEVRAPRDAADPGGRSPTRTRSAHPARPIGPRRTAGRRPGATPRRGVRSGRRPTSRHLHGADRKGTRPRRVVSTGQHD
jgi:RNA polymerase-binding transcription factor DksA